MSIATLKHVRIVWNHLIYVTGADDFVILVTARDMAAYEGLTRRIFYDNPNVRKFHTTVVMETVKAGLEIPL